MYVAFMSVVLYMYMSYMCGLEQKEVSVVREVWFLGGIMTFQAAIVIDIPSHKHCVFAS